jgi:opacity protein-like surface antigen
VLSDFATTGYVVGAGVERMLTQNWLIRAEYLHYGFGTSSGQLPLLGSAPGLTCFYGQCTWAISSSSLNFDTVRVSVSYKFGNYAYAAPASIYR